MNSWRFASKGFDPDLDLIYFEKRFYDFLMILMGKFAFVIPLLIWRAELTIPSLSAYVAPIIYGAITGAVAYGGYKAVQAFIIKKNAPK